MLGNTIVIVWCKYRTSGIDEVLVTMKGLEQNCNKVAEIHVQNVTPVTVILWLCYISNIIKCSWTTVVTPGGCGTSTIDKQSPPRDRKRLVWSCTARPLYVVVFDVWRVSHGSISSWQVSSSVNTIDDFFAHLLHSLLVLYSPWWGQWKPTNSYPLLHNSLKGFSSTVFWVDVHCHHAPVLHITVFCDVCSEWRLDVGAKLFRCWGRRSFVFISTALNSMKVL